MDAFAVSTTSIVIGELGDKTQLLTLLLATRLRRPLPIIAGVFVATALNHLATCWIGVEAGALLSPAVLRWLLGLSFIGIAIWALVPDQLEPETVETRSVYSVFVLTAWIFFMAEIGDKTQFVTLALAAKYHQVTPVVLGSTLGMMLVNVPTVLLAERATRWIPVKLVRMLAAVIYAALGIATLAGYSLLGA